MSGSTNSNYDPIFFAALARERYVQMSKINLIINLNKTITVTFDENGGSCSTSSKQVTYNSTYGRLPIATKFEREFAGWYTSKFGGNQVTSASKVTEMEDHVLYARWKSTVTFNPNGGTCDNSSQQVIEGNRYGTLPVPTRTGYTFAGWYTAQTGGSNVTATTTVPDTGNHTLYAHWTPALYMVTFDANGGTCTTSDKQVTYDSTYGTLPTPTRTGYTFDGWYTQVSGGNQVTETTKVDRTENHTLYAHWTIITYTIAYDANGGEGAPDSQEKEYGVDLDLSTSVPTRAGYEFLGWSISSTATTANYQPGGKYTANSGATLYAVWNKVEYTVTFDTNATGISVSPTSKTVTIGSQYGELPTPTRTGYTFAGWYTAASGGSQVTSTTIVNTTQDHILYAHWTTDAYTVTFDTNATGVNVSPASTSVTYGSTYGDLPTPTRTGYTFVGWFTGSAIRDTSKTYRDYPWLYYADAYGDLYNAFGYNESSLKNHYNNYGKNEGRRTSQYISSDTVDITEDITLYAGWTINTYTVSYNANGGSGAPDSQTKTYGEDLTLSSKAPTRSGYTFLGWGTSSTATSASYQPGGKYTQNSGTTLYAVWQQVIAVTSVTLNQTSDQWIPYKNNGSAGSLSLTATVAPNNATNKTVTWTSSNTSVATVSNGSVTAKGAGLTTITATAGGKSASVKVYVYNAVLKESAGAYWLRYSNGSQAQGTIVPYTGGAKLAISYTGNSLWYIHYKTNCSYNTWGSVDNYFSATSKLNDMFTNYGAY